MNPEDVNSWSTYLDFVKELEEAYEQTKSHPSSHHSKILYRGQADSEWGLKTTLERVAGENFCFDEYSRIVGSAREKMMCFSQNNLPWSGYDVKWNDVHKIIPNYEWTAYLRHHGFPSPLLDWSASPYVAAFFAFRNCDSSIANGKVAIYCYQEYLGQSKGGFLSAPWIAPYGPWVVVHPRHVIQQSEYTACVMKNEDGEIIFKSHESVMNRSSNASQDQLIKLEIPVSERDKAMKSLALMNITAYSLFQTEDAMAETLAKQLFGA